MFKWYKFADGYQCCVKGMSKTELYWEQQKHGKLVSIQQAQGESPWLNKAKGKEIKIMARLRLVNYLGQWELHNVESGKIVGRTTEETQTILKQMANTNGAEFTLEVV